MTPPEAPKPKYPRVWLSKVDLEEALPGCYHWCESKQVGEFDLPYVHLGEAEAIANERVKELTESRKMISDARDIWMHSHDELKARLEAQGSLVERLKDALLEGAP